MTRITLGRALGAMVASLGFVTGCGAADDGAERLGIIDHFGQQAEILAPSDVSVGEAFTLSLHTFGGGCITRHDTASSVSGLVAQVRPFDRESDPGEDGACNADLVELDHSVELTFAEPGDATVHVYGRLIDFEVEQEIVRSLTVHVGE